jgi:hypothetical protein
MVIITHRPLCISTLMLKLKMPIDVIYNCYHDETIYDPIHWLRLFVELEVLTTWPHKVKQTRQNHFGLYIRPT